MHIYHFAPYEPAALKRLASRHATRENELDKFLRAERFIDCHAVTKHGLRASVESYSLKELEKFIGFERKQDLRQASKSRRAVEWAIEFKDDDDAFGIHREIVERYNEEDCLATLRLRDWLEGAAAKRLLIKVITYPRPELKTGRSQRRRPQKTDHRRPIAING